MTESPSQELTPMLRQYFEIKEKYPNVFLFYRLGDFYELFFDDALKAAPLLNVTLTARGSMNGKEIPMCGVPFHAVDSYLAKLINTNHKVAICEQVEDPKQAKGVVKRKVLRVVTPGTVIDDSLLDSSKNNYLGAVTKAGAFFGFAYAELSTGEYKVTELREIGELEREISRIKPSELLIPKSLESFFSTREFFHRYQNFCLYEADWIFEHNHAFNLLVQQFKTHSLDGFGLGDSIPGVCAAGALLHYARENCPTALGNLNLLSRYQLEGFMSLDEPTKRNLELMETPGNQKGVSLIQILDRTQTPMGARLLRQWIHTPLRDLSLILERQNAVSELREQFTLLTDLRELLKSIQDMERIAGRVACGNASPRDLLGLRRSLVMLPSLAEKTRQLESGLIKNLTPHFKDYQEVNTLIEKGIREDAPALLRDGNVIKDGFNAEIDELRDISKNAKIRLAEIQQSEVDKTGIKNLKIKFNNVFGYYFEVSKGNLDMVPDYFIRKQTLVNGERFITQDLKELETKILGAEQKSLALEQKLFQELREEVARHTEDIKVSTLKVAILDVLCSLAEISAKNHFTRPEVTEDDRIYIREGRHPVVESLLEPGAFVSNDTEIDGNQNQILLITGPNMAGKSTYIRQVALIVLLAQVGSHVPAKEASIGIVDRIFTRVGAYDDLSGGKSTFMVEMNETANILNNATHRSLIILDEIGRGTSTFDGISIAWAVIEYLYYQSSVKAKTLFATHFHELTTLEKTLRGIKNFNIAVKEWNDDILFLRKIVEGPADKSYGIHVARLAGLPKDLINRAKELLATLESGGTSKLKESAKEEKASTLQLDLFSPPVVEKVPKKIEDFLRKMTDLDPLNKTPMQSLELLTKIAEEAKTLSENL